MTKEKKFERGITLIALIITVIIMVILAAISINSIYNMGIVEKAVEGSQEYAAKSVEENQMIGNVENLIEDTVGNIEKIENGGIPPEYQKVEYIESTGTQWIDTLLISDVNNKVYYDIDFEVDILDGTSNRIPIGCQTFAHYHYFLQVYLSRLYTFNDQTWNNCTNLRNNVKFYLTNWYLNGQLINDSIIYPTTTDNIYLFKWGNNLSKNRLYKVFFYNENRLLKNFIPCYCTEAVTNVEGETCEAGTIGIYDTVENKFYTNKGTGTFLKGEDVN